MYIDDSHESNIASLSVAFGAADDEEMHTAASPVNLDPCLPRILACPALLALLVLLGPTSQVRSDER